MSKIWTTVAEIFIVLALVFLIQTMINFAISDDPEATVSANFVTLSIRQVPSAGSEADHLSYIDIGGISWVADDATLTTEDLSKQIQEETGECVDYRHPYSFPDINTDVEVFKKKLQTKNIEFYIVEISGMQPEYLLSWYPQDLSNDVIVKVGFENCNLTSTPESLKIDSIWNVSANKLSHPHPIIITIEKFTDHIETSSILDYFHKDQISKSSESIVLQGPQFGRISSKRDVCPIQITSLDVSSLRSFLVKEFSFNLREI